MPIHEKESKSFVNILRQIDIVCMSGKQVKRLRRLAESLSVGMPKVGWFNTVKTIELKNGKKVDKITVRLTPNTTRAVYQGLKEIYRTGGL